MPNSSKLRCTVCRTILVLWDYGTKQIKLYCRTCDKYWFRYKQYCLNNKNLNRKLDEY